MSIRAIEREVEEEEEEEEIFKQIIRDGLRSMDIEVRLERLWMQSEVDARTNAARAARTEREARAQAARAAEAEARVAAAEETIRSCLARERVLRDRCMELEAILQAHAMRSRNRKRCRIGS